MRAGTRFGILFAIGVFCGVLAWADITRSGEVVGTVESDDGTILPGATVKLAGETLIQREITQTADERGGFRFLNVNPGSYTLTVTMEGFGPREVAVTVNVGRTSTLDVVLPLARTAAEVTVRGEAPLIDKTTPQFQTNYTATELAQIPSSRNYIDVVDTAPGVDNRMAFGAGGNVDGYDRFGFGAATNQYQINGVGTSNLQFGNTWVNPNYDTIAEVQIVGPGASAEYSEFTGAVINVVTKTGTNDFHGGFTVYGTSDTFQANNSGGIIDLAQPTTKYAVQSNAYIGGPIIAEKLLFFASGAYNKSSNAPIQTEFFDADTRPAAQLRLDYLANTQHTISAMYDYEPIKLTDQGLQPGLGEEVGYFREQHTNTGYLSWVSTWGPNTLTEFKYGGGEGYLGRIPNNTTDVSVYDGFTGLTYNSTGFQRVQRNWRHEGRGSATHYVNDFLKASHEFKAGAEYAWQRSRQDLTSNQNLLLSLTPAGDLTYVSATQGYNYHVATSLQRPGVYIQDKAAWERLTVNLGFRYDNPKTIDDNTGKTMLDFHNFSPRVGLSYDMTGKGTTVASASYGRYYDKVPTYGPGTYAGTGTPEITGYGVVTDQVFDPQDWEAIAAFLIHPENITYTFNSTAIPVVDDTNNPFSDIITARLEHQFTPRVAASVSYLYRYTTDYVSLVNIGNPTIYTPFDYTSDFTGRTFPIYAVTGGGPTRGGAWKSRLLVPAGPPGHPGGSKPADRPLVPQRLVHLRAHHRDARQQRVRRPEPVHERRGRRPQQDQQSVLHRGHAFPEPPLQLQDPRQLPAPLGHHHVGRLSLVLRPILWRERVLLPHRGLQRSVLLPGPPGAQGRAQAAQRRRPEPASAERFPHRAGDGVAHRGRPERDERGDRLQHEHPEQHRRDLPERVHARPARP